MDRRIKYTKKIIKDTLLEILREKDINKITVSEICKKADINRATFYRYYLDVYDLLDKIQDEFGTELKNVLDKDDYTVSTFSKDILNVFLSNKELVRILFNTQNNTNFLNDILEFTYDKFFNKWKSDLPNVNDENILLANVFIFNGALGVINYWIKNDFSEDVDEIANTIETLSSFGTKRYIYNK